jgi:hypothetical protein
MVFIRRPTLRTEPLPKIRPPTSLATLPRVSTRRWRPWRAWHGLFCKRIRWCSPTSHELDVSRISNLQNWIGASIQQLQAHTRSADNILHIPPLFAARGQGLLARPLLPRALFVHAWRKLFLETYHSTKFLKKHRCKRVGSRR